jgi:hypothetical protein
MVTMKWIVAVMIAVPLVMAERAWAKMSKPGEPYRRRSKYHGYLYE